MNLLILFKHSNEPWKLKMSIICSFGFSETDGFHPAQIAAPSFESSYYRFQPNKAFYPNLSFTERKKIFRPSLSQRHINYNYNMLREWKLLAKFIICFRCTCIKIHLRIIFCPSLMEHWVPSLTQMWAASF